MKIIRQIFSALTVFALINLSFGGINPSINLEELLVKAERNPQILIDAQNLAVSKQLPVRVYLPGKIVIQATGIENGEPVYAVMTNPANPFIGEALYYAELSAKYDINSGKIDFGNGSVIDNTGGMFEPVLSPRLTNNLLLVPDWTLDKVIAFDAITGNIVDTSFIPPDNPHLQSPKMALQSPWGTIMVPDQVSDAVQEYDTAGVFIRTFASTSLDNIRGICFRPNNNLLVTVGSGSMQNTVQQFNTAGTNIGTFMTGLTSPFDILYRVSDYLVSNSSAPNDVAQFDTAGTFIAPFFAGTQIVFAQQLYKMANGNIAVAGFSTPSGIIILSPTGTYIQTLTGVTGCRGVFQLPSGNFLAANGTGVHEIDDTTGNLVRTIMTGANFQYINLYNPNFVGVQNGNNKIPGEYKLENNYPNPFNPSTTIKFSIPENGLVKLSIFDVTGKEIKTIINNEMNAGNHETLFNADGFASGLYFYKLQVNGFTDVKKMILIK